MLVDARSAAKLESFSCRPSKFDLALKLTVYLYEVDLRMAMFFSADAAFLSQFNSLLEKMLCFALRDVCAASIRKAN